MAQSIHQQLIHGITALNASQVKLLQDFLAQVQEGQEPLEAADADAEPQAEDIPGAAEIAGAVEIASAAQTASATEEADDADVALDLTDEEGLGIDGDLPQPVCAQDEQLVPPPSSWGPPPLAGINDEQMQLIACLIREANEARNARRQRFGL